METVIIIPARYGSSRFPGKPLVEIKGKSLLQRTWLIATAVKGVDAVYIATDDERLRDHAEGFGARVVMTSSNCRNGTERVYEAVKALKISPQQVINLQGDALLTPPWVLQAMVDELRAHPEVAMVTPAVRLTPRQYDELMVAKQGGKAGGTLVTFDKAGNALYFSKSPIPFIRKDSKVESYVHRHIGLYGYRWATLERLLGLEPGPLEQLEQLEQLRALENGLPIKIVLVDYQGRTHWSVDSPEDAVKAEEIITREGELVG